MSHLAKRELLHFWEDQKSIILDLGCLEMCFFSSYSVSRFWWENSNVVYITKCSLTCEKNLPLLISKSQRKIFFLSIFCFYSKTVYDKWCPFPFCHVPGSANYHVDTVDRYFSPRTPPVFMSPGGTKIKVSVGDTVTIPCKIHNKGKFWWNSFLKDCT